MYPENIDRFTEKLNKVDGNTYVIEEEVAITNGVYEGELQHDNVSTTSVRVYTGSKLTGDKIDNFVLSTPSLTPWKKTIKIFSDKTKVYITYETQGDTIEADDINKVQESIVNIETEVDRYKSTNDVEVSNLKTRATNLENNKAEKTYVDTELNKRYLKEQVFTKEEVLRKIQDVIGTAPQALDTLQEIAKSLNNDADFAGTITKQLATKVDKVQGKQLSTEDYTTSEKSKLAGIQENANNYIHPPTHPASSITGLSKVAISNNYNDLDNKPTSLPANGGTSQNANAVANDYEYMKFHWSGQEGQPSWLWGGNDYNNMYVYNPSNFNVNYANSSGNTNKFDGHNGNAYMRYTGWINEPGYDANTIPENKSGFTYSNNAPATGPLIHHAAGGYGLQFNASYTGLGEYLYFRTHNGDGGGGWNPWHKVWNDANFNPNSKSDTGHIHDDRYYTESEANNKFVSKTDLGNAGYGDMLKSAYDKDNDGVVDKSEDSDTVDGKHGNEFQYKSGDNYYQIGSTSSGSTGVWYKIGTWTVGSQYNGFQFAMRLSKRGNIRQDAELHIRAEYGASSWNSYEFYVTGFEMSSEETFLLALNNTNKTVTLYYKRGSDWNLTVGTIISHYLSGASYSYINSSTGSTTQPTDDIVLLCDQTSRYYPYLTKRRIITWNDLKGV